MTAVEWFFASGVLCVIAAYFSLFTVTLRKGMNGWVCAAFVGGAMLDNLLVLMTILKPQ